VKRPGRSALLRLAISVGLLVLLFGFIVEPQAVLAQLRVALQRPGLLLAAALLYCVLGTIVRGFRWRTLIQAQGHPIAVTRVSEIFLVGVFFNQFLPTAIGGDVIRALMVAEDGLGRARAANTVIVDRALGLLPQLAIGLLALTFARHHATPAVSLTLLVTGLVGFVGLTVLFRADAWSHLAARLPLVGRLWRRPGIARFVEAFAQYDRRSLAVAAGWGFAFAFLQIGANAALGWSLGIDQMDLFDWAIFVPLVALSTLLPSIGGWGVREVLYVGLLATLTPPVSQADATALSIMIGGLNLLVAAVGGLVYGLGSSAGLPRIDRLVREAKAGE
jgi:uncharacterized protein (TIRG00374 family)